MSEPIKKFTELLDVMPSDRVPHELRILEGLFSQAIKDKKYSESLKIMEAAQRLIARHGRR